MKPASWLQGRGGSLHRSRRPLRSATPGWTLAAMPQDRARVTLFPVALTLALCVLDAVASGFMYWSPEFATFWQRLTQTLPPWLIAALLFPLVNSICRRVPLDLTGRSLLVHSAASIAFALFHTALIGSFNTFRYYPQLTWAQAYQRSLFWNLVVMTALYWLFAGALQILDSRRALRQREEDSLQLKASLAEARLAGLRAQLNPHFLYNVLDTAAMLAREQRTAEVISVLARLGELLRYVLTEGASGDAELRDEVDFLRRYLELERIRFADRLQVSIDVDADVQGMRLPSLLLQPLVENAVRHGISQKPGAGRISIRAHRAGPNLQLEVRDDGPGPSAQSTPHSGVGVRNTRDRLSTRYGACARLTVDAAPGGGTVAVVTIPCEEAA